jgi:hypothetical protein
LPKPQTLQTGFTPTPFLSLSLFGFARLADSLSANECVEEFYKKGQDFRTEMNGIFISVTLPVAGLIS